MEQKAGPLLEVEAVGAAHDGVPALHEVSLNLAAGEVLAVLGPSGCGKSTLLRTIAGLEPLSSGRIRCAGQDLAGVPPHRREFALMFQDGQLFTHLDVAANVGYGLKLRRVPARERAARVAELLDVVGLAGYERRLPQTLSGGERQRVALARALAPRPRLVLLDEPLSALDASLREHLAEEVADILRRAGTTALWVTHDHEEAFAVASSLALMRQGRIVQTGPVAEVWAHPVDAWAAEFLGYARVVSGAAARALLGEDQGGGQVALRRSALVVDPAGAFSAVVRSARSTPDGVRLEVELDRVRDGSGGPLVVDAVAGAGAGHGPGSVVRLRVDPTRLARLG